MGRSELKNGTSIRLAQSFKPTNTPPLPTLESTTNTPLSTLPPACYRPDGTNCEWYKDCLEKKYPCQDQPADYAMKYATKYCELYTKNYNDFSATGQKWVDGVRKCLQIKMVPLISQSSSSNTCEKIKNEAFASHTPCYTDPYPDSPLISFCYLGFKDTFFVFNTIKSAFGTEFKASMEGLFNTMQSCFQKDLDDVMHLLKMVVSIKPSAPVSRISEMFHESDELAKLIAEGIANSESWDPKRVDYFPYPADTWVVRGKTHEQQITIEILIADKLAWDNMDNRLISNDAESYLDQIVDRLVQSIQQGKLEIKTTNGTFYVEKIEQCPDMNCNPIDGNFAIHSVNINVFINMGLMFILLLKN
ncbi:unnamed protein product [Adineta steineri]|uniref:Uncharacterized protein n=1 Tax=Adineta steineri TaxID=433720 RepID=A0A813NS58_9BILA|nr:unnamed protein product [Adineta steineri]CAF3955625.1 unnamed protein product [Adineta steineri]